jgi:hypothetical protein
LAKLKADLAPEDFMFKHAFDFIKTPERIFNKLLKDIPNTAKEKLAILLLASIVAEVFFVTQVIMLLWIVSVLR